MLFVCEICKRSFTTQAECQKHEAECKTTKSIALDIASTMEQMITEARAAGIAIGTKNPEKNNHCNDLVGVEYDHHDKAIYLDIDY